MFGRVHGARKQGIVRTGGRSERTTAQWISGHCGMAWCRGGECLLANFTGMAAWMVRMQQVLQPMWAMCIFALNQTASDCFYWTVFEDGAQRQRQLCKDPLSWTNPLATAVSWKFWGESAWMYGAMHTGFESRAAPCASCVHPSMWCNGAAGACSVTSRQPCGVGRLQWRCAGFQTKRYKSQVIYCSAPTGY